MVARPWRCNMAARPESRTHGPTEGAESPLAVPKPCGSSISSCAEQRRLCRVAFPSARLLDWTESPLVALYFACCESAHADKQAAVWALDPNKLNEAQMGERAIHVAEQRDVKRAVAAAFDRQAAADSTTQKALALMTDHFDLRHFLQASNFTIQGASTPLEAAPAASQHLVKYLISAEAKAELLQLLDVLGIRASQLFPDLDHLSADLQRRTYPTP
jgi:hypothetical protein